MKAKPFMISKSLVFAAFKRVRSNKGSGGIDGVSLEEYDKDFGNHLYKLCNQMSSGSYMPPAVKLIEIPRKNGGKRPLGVPTISDRIAQTVVKAYLNQELDEIFHEDSHGYRPNKMKDALKERMETCGLELHPEKTRILYCKDSNRRRPYERVSFDFLGYTFMPRLAQHGQRKEWFTNCLPAVSKSSMKQMNRSLKRMNIFRDSGATLTQLASNINPILRGWISYYRKFYKTTLKKFMHNVNVKIASWARRKYKNLHPSEMKAVRWLHGISQNSPNLFAHWQLLGAKPTCSKINVQPIMEAV